MINLTHTVQEVELLLTALRKLPMEITEDLVMKLRSQAVPQVQAAQAAEQAAQQSKQQNVTPPVETPPAQ